MRPSSRTKMEVIVAIVLAFLLGVVLATFMPSQIGELIFRTIQGIVDFFRGK